MRRLAALALICLAIAAPAVAGPNGKITVVKQPTPAASDSGPGLRGSQRAGQTGGPAAATLSAIPAPLAQSWTQPIPQANGADAIQCRTACAQTYYFCNAGGDEDCSGRWAQCAASCSATSTAQPYQPAF
jgi:hypothetical protein